MLEKGLKNVDREEEVIVLSMYDGIATGRYCLEQLGLKNIKYFAYEIEKTAIAVATNNFPDIIECGDAFGVRESNWNIMRLAAVEGEKGEKTWLRDLQ